MNFFLDDPINSFVENLLMKSTEKAKRIKPAPGKYNPYDDSPLLAPTSHDGKDPDTPQYGKHWSRYAPRARMAENQMKRRKELQLALDTIAGKAKKGPSASHDPKPTPRPTKTPKPPKRTFPNELNPPGMVVIESARDRVKRILEEIEKKRASSTKQLSGGEREVDFTPPEGVRSAARRGIEYHSKGLAGDGFMSATLIRAHKIADGNKLTLEHVKRMHSFFERHANGRSKKAKKGEITPWDVAWLAWGGNAGRSWAASKVAVTQKARKNIMVVPPQPKEGYDYFEGKNIPPKLDRYGRRRPMYEDGSYGYEQRVFPKPPDKPKPANKGKLLRKDAVRIESEDGSVRYENKIKRR